MSDENGDEDDWFERALREMEDEAEEPEAPATEPAESEAEPEPETESAEPEEEAVEPEEETAEPEEAEPGAGGAARESEESERAPFEEDFASAFESAPGPDFGGEGGEEEGGFGGEDFGFGGEGGFGGEEGFGFGPGPGAGSEQTFDEEEAEFESEIDRIKLGIEGLDQMILGGVPERSLLVAIGSAGTGKTTFALQFLHKALTDGERAVYLTLEESREAILETATEKGWEFREFTDQGQLAVVHLDPIEMANSLANIRNDLPRLVKEFDADRLVLDSVSLLEMMYDRASERRTEVFEFTQALKEAGVTTMVTSEASQETPYNSRYGIIEYLSDAVFVLQYVRPSDFRETRLAVEIQKIRDANHSRETKPYEITDEGISVYRQANIF
ncbi:KaiC domain-containing protein [Haloplanus sp. GCM10025708]|uniref:KaiC domain-containing protein n=1 Tax=Haloferacaceae TaxID=1644056 RepID=UPI00361909DD